MRNGVSLVGAVILAFALVRTFDTASALVIGATFAVLAGWAWFARTPVLRLTSALVFCGLLIGLSWLSAYEADFGPIGYDDFVAVYQTDIKEASWFIGSYFKPASTVYPVLATLGFLAIAYPGRRRRAGSITAAAVIAVSAAILSVELRPEAVAHWDRLASSARDFSVRRASLGGGPTLGPLNRTRLTGNIVLVLGESTTRRHMSLYGYHRSTTPMLDSLRSELLVQTDTISPYTFTTATVLPMFGVILGTDAPRPLPVDLLSALRGSGVKTFWFSNQNQFGIWENPVTMIAKTADVWQFQKRGFKRDSDALIHDEGLVPRLQQALSDPAPAKFITLHFYATHWIYCDVVPHSPDDLGEADGLGKKFFGIAPDRSPDVNCYDNAVRYVDRVLSEIIALAQRTQAPTTVVFVSDHGENPAAGTNHSGPHSAYQVEVPLVWYFNPAGRRLWQRQIDALRSHLSDPFLNADLGHSLLDLAGAEGRLFNAKRSLVSPSFQPEPRRLLARSSTTVVNYDTLEPDRKDYLEIARGTLRQLRASRPADWNKTWAHRVNSLGKLMETKDIFAGVELDVVFDARKGAFFVYHPPSPDIGLSLEEYLKAASSRPDLRMWFDWQNAQIDTFDASLMELARLDRRFDLRRRIVVETHSDATFTDLQRLKKNGFFHAYYLPTEEIQRCAEPESPAECARLAQSIQQTAVRIGADAISFDTHAAGFVHASARYLSGFKLLTWDLDVNSAALDFVARLPPLDRYEAYLAVFPSAFNH